MKSTRITLTLVFLTLLTATYGQNTEKSTRKSMNIYEYGVPLTSCESNFKNLFNNWERWVENHENTKLLSYNYIETLSSKKLIEEYSNRINNLNSLGSRIEHSSSETGHGENTIYREVNRVQVQPIYSSYPVDISLDRSEQNKLVSLRDSILNAIKNRFKNDVEVGDEVYEINLKINQKEYKHFVICRPKAHKIVFDNVFLGIDRNRNR